MTGAPAPAQSAGELLLAAEKLGAERERKVCAQLVCDRCATGDPPILDERKSRRRAVESARSAIRTAFAFEAVDTGAAVFRHDPDGAIRADANSTAHQKLCLLCRAGSEGTCRALGAAHLVDRYLDHRRTCRQGANLRAVMRAGACALRLHAHQRVTVKAEAEVLDYPDECFHVLGNGDTVRCAASAILLRGDAPADLVAGAAS